MAIIDKVSVCVALAGVLLLGGSAHAKTAALKCQEAKLKALGKLQLCLKKNSAKVLGGKPDASAACKTKFAEALTKAGTGCRYLDNGDGTVSDLNTGLVWEKKVVTCPSGPHCYNTNYTRSTGAPYNETGTAFTTFLYGLNGGTSPNGVATTGCFADHCDWRLPTVEELVGIVDATQGICSGSTGACIDPEFGPTLAGYYWSATTLDGSPPGLAWIMGFNGAGADADDKTVNLYARAVRGGF